MWNRNKRDRPSEVEDLTVEVEVVGSGVRLGPGRHPHPWRALVAPNWTKNNNEDKENNLSLHKDQI
jgi:hypothetical protein